MEVTWSINDFKRHFGLLCCLLANDTNNKGRKESLMRRKETIQKQKKKGKVITSILSQTLF